MTETPVSRSIQVVLVEDGKPRRILMERGLHPTGATAIAVEDGTEAEKLLREGGYDVVVADRQRADDDRPLGMIRGNAPDGEVIVLSADGEQPDLTLSAPYGYLTRPLPHGSLRAEEERSATAPSADSVRHRLGKAAEKILGASPGIDKLLATVERVAPSAASVLVVGETGTGKSLVARAVHEASPRAGEPFVVVNCSAFQDQLLENELFGHEKGAFTGAVGTKRGLFEVAHRGTLFLDEVAEMSPAMQAKLLQVLDTGEMRRVGGTKSRRVDVRVISATNKRMKEEVESGRFREDLLFRLDVIRLAVPPLRERRDDIPILASHFLAGFHPSGQPAKSLSPAALRILQEHDWPGNIRELANTLEGLTLLAPKPVIDSDDLPSTLRTPVRIELEEPEAPLPMSEIERLHVARTLRYTEGKKAPAARLLGIDVKTLNNKIRRYDIEV